MKLAEINGEHLALAITTLIGIIMTALLTCVTAYFQWRSKKDVAEINDAVNHRHEKRGSGALKLYDLVWENHVKANELIEWKRTYDDGPLSTGEKVDRFVAETNRDIKTIKEAVSKCDEHPPCAMHQSRADDLARLVKLHEKELKEQG